MDWLGDIGGETALDDGAPKRDNSQAIQASVSGSYLRHDPMSPTASQPDTVRLLAAHTAVRCGAISPPLSAPQSCTCGRKPLSAQTACLLPRPPGETPACHRCHPSGSHLVESLVRLAAALALVQPATFVTAHPTAAWTLQQLREAIPANHGYRFLLHDRDSIFSQQLDQCVHNLGLRVLKTPPHSPQANALCERLLGTLRRECLDFMIPFTENHLRCLLSVWVHHYNACRPHMSLGPGIPQPPASLPVALCAHRHRLLTPYQVVACPILGGLHHDYRLAQKAA